MHSYRGLYSENIRSESACKPGSVVDNHSSRFYVAVKLKQPTLAKSGLTKRPLFGLAPDGVCHAISVT